MNQSEENLVSLNTDNDLLPPPESQKTIEPDWITPECPGPTVLLSPESHEVIEPYLPESDHRRTGNPTLKQIADLFKNMAAEMNGVMMIALWIWMAL